MKGDSVKKLEQFAARALPDAVTDLQPQLAARGLVAELKPLRSSGFGDTYESEIGVYIWRGAVMVDAIEYLLYSAGQPRMTEAELADAVDRDFKSALARE